MKKNKGLIFIIVVLVILLAICLVIIYKNNYTETKNEVLSSGENVASEESLNENTAKTSNTVDESNEVEEITDEERKDVEKYVDKICNESLNSKLPIFNNINEADKAWVYSHLKSEDETNYLTEEQIKKQLNNMFGDILNINVENDIKSTDNAVMPIKIKDGKMYGNYELPFFGMDNLTYYIIDNIEIIDNQYHVKVVEFNICKDWDNSNDTKMIYLISTYDKTITENRKWKTVFEATGAEVYHNEDTNKPSTQILENVIKQKDKFQNYNIIIEKNDNFKYNVLKVEEK